MPRSSAALVGGAEDQDANRAAVAGAPKGARGPRQVGEGAALPQGQGAAVDVAVAATLGVAMKDGFRSSSSSTSGCSRRGSRCRWRRRGRRGSSATSTTSPPSTRSAASSLSVLVDVYPDLSTHLDEAGVLEAVGRGRRRAVQPGGVRRGAAQAARPARRPHREGGRRGDGRPARGEHERLLRHRRRRQGRPAAAGGGRRVAADRDEGGEVHARPRRGARRRHRRRDAVDRRHVPRALVGAAAGGEGGALRGRRDQGADAPAPWR